MAEPHRNRVDVEVRYFETDQMGVVHHANYLVWFELARTDLCVGAGFHYADIETLGYRLMNSEVNVRYRRPARYGDTVAVSCWIHELASRAVGFRYEVRRGENLLATGTTRHLWVDASTGKHCRAPERVREPFLRLAGRNG